MALSVILTPAVASFGAAVVLTPTLMVTGQYPFDVEKILGSFILIWTLGLIIAPFSWAYALTVQLPLSFWQLRTAEVGAWLYLLTSAMSGLVLLFVALSVTGAVFSGQSLLPNLQKHDEIAGIFLLLGVGAAGGLSSGLLFWMVVCRASGSKTTNG